MKNKILIGLGVFVSCTILVICLRFAINFGVDLGDQNAERWLTVASFYNNALSPGLLIISIILIFFTWQTSKKELEATREYIHDSRSFDLFKVHLREFCEDLSNPLSKELVENSVDTFIEYGKERLMKDIEQYFRENKLTFPERIDARLYKRELTRKLGDCNFGQVILCTLHTERKKAYQQFLTLKSLSKELFKSDQTLYAESIFTHKFTELLRDISLVKDKETFIKELIFCVGKYRLPSLIELIEGEDPKVSAIVREIEKRLK